MSFTNHVKHPILPRIVIFSNTAITMITVFIALLEFDKINGLYGDGYRNVVKLIIITSLFSSIDHCHSGNIL